MLAVLLIMAVAALAAVGQKASQKSAAARAASTSRPTSPDPKTPPATSHSAGPRPTAAAPATGATRYANVRFGFSFGVPAGYQAATPPADGDGLTFTSPGRAATVSGYGSPNVLGRSPSAEMAAVVKSYQSARDTITYRFFRNDVIAVSGTTPHGMVFYQREIVYPAVIYTLLWSYPAAGATQYDALVTQTVISFVPGPAHSG